MPCKTEVGQSRPSVHALELFTQGDQFLLRDSRGAASLTLRHLKSISNAVQYMGQKVFSEASLESRKGSVLLLRAQCLLSFRRTTCEHCSKERKQMYLNGEAGRAVKAALAQRGHTQKGLAEALGASRITVWRTLRGRRRISARERRRIAQFLNLGVNSLFPSRRAKTDGGMRPCR